MELRIFLNWGKIWFSGVNSVKVLIFSSLNFPIFRFFSLHQFWIEIHYQLRRWYKNTLGNFANSQNYTGLEGYPTKTKCDFPGPFFVRKLGPPVQRFWSESWPAQCYIFGQTRSPPDQRFLVGQFVKNVPPVFATFFGQKFWLGNPSHGLTSNCP